MNVPDDFELTRLDGVGWPASEPLPDTVRQGLLVLRAELLRQAEIRLVAAFPTRSRDITIVCKAVTPAGQPFLGFSAASYGMTEEVANHQDSWLGVVAFIAEDVQAAGEALDLKTSANKA
jgi:hypothetical protein